ncbi:hypothetical protein RFI_05871 [Reticulomyxa filosa]|uniref:Transmembrane protein n=1 Tax=Reticulomyxa filosa TaxID=46433 RepID=X6NZ54_RETFI|nr:hypothetical protein RFI_05871 [Reticulomyxa filosa]|eukprot:ETO31251.1 hypothetical protein RFI_05871 [Reticulomyxa filosa]
MLYVTNEAVGQQKNENGDAFNFLPHFSELKWETLSTMRALSAGAVLIVVFILIAFNYILGKKSRHITYAINRWILSHLCFCLFSALVFACWTWTTNTTVAFEWVVVVLFVSNFFIFVSLLSMIMLKKGSADVFFDKLNCTIKTVFFFFPFYVTFIASSYTKKKKKGRQKKKSDEIYELPLLERFSNDQYSFLFGIITVPFAIVCAFGWVYRQEDFHSGSITFYVFGSVILPFGLWALYIIALSKFVIVIFAYAISLIIWLNVQNGVNWVLIVFWSQMFYLLVPLLSLFALGEKKRLVRIMTTTKNKFDNFFFNLLQKKKTPKF